MSTVEPDGPRRAVGFAAVLDDDDLPVADPEFDLVVCDVDVLLAPGDLRRGVDLVLASGVVQAVDPAPSPAREFAAETMDGRGLLAVPGLVDAHTHSPDHPVRGVGDGLALEPWLATSLDELGTLTPEDHYWRALAGATELLCSGATAVVDHLPTASLSPGVVDGAMRAYRDAGIRGGVAPFVADDDATLLLAADLGVDVAGLPAMIPQGVPAVPTREVLAAAEDAIGRWHGTADGRLHVLAGIAGVGWASDELLGGMAALAERHGTTMQLHAAETRVQAAACRLRDGRSAVATLDALGVLGDRVSLAHGVWVDEEDVDRIARCGATVVHTPAADARRRSGRAPVAALLRAGAPVAVGTDGVASGDDRRAWVAMRLAAVLHRDPDGPWVGATDALRIATSGGAGVLGVPGLGTLVPGAPADAALLDRRGDAAAGARELEDALVWAGPGAGVRHVIVAGEIVVRDGNPTRVDVDEVRRRVADLGVRRARTGAGSSALKTMVDRLDEVRRRLAAREGRPFVGP